MKRKSEAKKAAEPSASELIDARIKDLPDWRGRLLSRLRALIRQADPDVVEEWKWGIPVWSHDGLICTGEVYKGHVKTTFAKGASLEDPSGLFNSSLEGNVRRAIDFQEGAKLDEKAFKALIRAAVALNTSRVKPAAAKAKARSPAATRSKAKPATSKPVILSGGNPQIAKGDGDGPVQAYIAAIPDEWKRDAARYLDVLIVRTVPKVRKAVRWNSPFYGVEGQGWFLSFHCFNRYLKVTFLRGTSLRPLPPVESKDPNTRYFHIHEDEDLDARLLTDWIKQAAQIPGDPLF